MASWATHLIIADSVMKQCPELDKHGFCVGNIAPDCNVENEDWTTLDRSLTNPISMSREEFVYFVNNTASLAVSKLREMNLI